MGYSSNMLDALVNSLFFERKVEKKLINFIQRPDRKVVKFLLGPVEN